MKKIIKYVLIIKIINELTSIIINNHKNFLFNSSEIILKIDKTGIINILTYSMELFRVLKNNFFLNQKN